MPVLIRRRRPRVACGQVRRNASPTAHPAAAKACGHLQESPDSRGFPRARRAARGNLPFFWRRTALLQKNGSLPVRALHPLRGAALLAARPKPSTSASIATMHKPGPGFVRSGHCGHSPRGCYHDAAKSSVMAAPSLSTPERCPISGEQRTGCAVGLAEQSIRMKTPPFPAPTCRVIAVRPEPTAWRRPAGASSRTRPGCPPPGRSRVRSVRPAFPRWPRTDPPAQAPAEPAHAPARRVRLRGHQEPPNEPPKAESSPRSRRTHGLTANPRVVRSGSN